MAHFWRSVNDETSKQESNFKGNSGARLISGWFSHGRGTRVVHFPILSKIHQIAVVNWIHVLECVWSTFQCLSRDFEFFSCLCTLSWPFQTFTNVRNYVTNNSKRQLKVNVSAFSLLRNCFTGNNSCFQHSQQFQIVSVLCYWPLQILRDIMYSSFFRWILSHSRMISSHSNAKGQDYESQCNRFHQFFGWMVYVLFRLSRPWESLSGENVYFEVSEFVSETRTESRAKEIMLEERFDRIDAAVHFHSKTIEHQHTLIKNSKTKIYYFCWRTIQIIRKVYIGRFKGPSARLLSVSLKVSMLNFIYLLKYSPARPTFKSWSHSHIQYGRENHIQFVEKAWSETIVYFQKLFFSHCGDEIAWW
jgi:hypothetical protein